jgi:hypothetical protein
MNKDDRLNELYRERDNYYPKLLNKIIGIPLVSLVTLFFIILTGYELRIRMFGEQTEFPIEQLVSGNNEYFVCLKLGNSIVQKEVKKKTFEQLKKGQLMTIIYWEPAPRMSIFLDLNERNDVYKLALGIPIFGALLFGTIKRVKNKAKEIPR